MSDGSRYFNPIPLFILFREAIEASIVVAVLLTFLQRSSPQLKKQVWWGVGVGIGIALVLAGVFAACFYVAQNNVFTGVNLLIFKGTISWVACLFITYLAFAMLRYEGWERKWERKLAAQGVKKIVDEEQRQKEAAEAAEEEGVEAGMGSKNFQKNPLSDSTLPQPLVSAELKDDAFQARPNPSDLDLPRPVPAGACGWWHRIRYATTGFLSKYTLFFVVFFTVLREGMESIIFLFGVGNADPVSIPISGLIGILCGVMVGVVLYYTGKSVRDIKWLLISFATVLFFIAAGSAELGAEALMYAGMFGPYVLPRTAYTMPGVGGISSYLYGGEGQPPAPSAAGGAAASAFNDGDEIVVTGPVDLNDGYVYVMTTRQPWWQESLWDISACCGDTDDKNKFFSLIKPIFGYNSQPTFIDAVFYMGYWFVVLSIGMWKYYKGTLTDADWKHNAMLRKEQEAADAALAAKTADVWTPSDPLALPAAEGIQMTNPVKGAGAAGSDRGASSDEHAAASSEARGSEERGSPSAPAERRH